MRQPKNYKPAEKKALSLESCLAKSRKTEGGTEKGRTVEEHCRAAGAVGEALLARLFALWPDGANIFPKNAALAPLVHDVGKVCPTFQKKIYDAIDSVPTPKELDGVDASSEIVWGKHSAVSYAALKLDGAPDAFAWSAGLHHGRNPRIKPGDCGHFGGASWAAARKTLLERLKGDREWSPATGSTETLLLTGLTIASDWIASGEIFEDPAVPWAPLVDEAVSAAGFNNLRAIPGLSFSEIFGFAANACQRALADATNGPGVYILEAPMGSGKTEAALYAAYRAISEGRAAGLYFALPTQLTSNKIHERVNEFLKKILPGSAGSVLAHSGAWLARARLRMGKEAAPGGQWFEHGPRAILAPYAVGTVDQALMATMRSSWAGLRLFGLAGKIVIFDEIHSYDAYAGALIDALIKHLATMGSTVIILSATLTAERRESLLRAANATLIEANPAYPLLSVAPRAGDAKAARPEEYSDEEVEIVFTDDDELALEEILDRADAGQQAVWIENTARMAQAVFRKLAARAANLDVSVGLLHSRFTAGDRAASEGYWTEILGKKGERDGEKRTDRGRILVGTQVIEQSIDIDADFMVSRFAPTDLVLQRLGRLWRHKRDNRPASARREAWLLAPDLASALENPKGAFAESGSSRVYSPYTLARSLEAWQNRERILLPGDIRELIEASHAPREEEPTAAMEAARDALNNDIETKINFALRNASDASPLISEDTAGARLCETENVKILLLTGLDLNNKRCVVNSPETINLEPPTNYDERALIAAKLSLETVSVPVYDAPDPAPQAVQDLFKPYFHEAKIRDSASTGKLRILVIDKAGAANDVYGSPLENIYYNRRTGYWRERS